MFCLSRNEIALKNKYYSASQTREVREKKMLTHSKTTKEKETIDWQVV